MATKFYQLPATAVPFCISDVHSSFAFMKESESEEDGKNIRVCGRVKYYDPIKEVLCLREQNKPSRLVQTTTPGQELLSLQEKTTTTSNNNTFLLVDTSLIGSFDFNCRKGSQILCVGELQSWKDSRLAEPDLKTGNFLRQGGVGDWEWSLVLKATICKLLDGLDYEKYRRYVDVIQRKISSPC